MKGFAPYLLVIVTLLALGSCKKERRNPNGITVQGGNVTVTGRVMHHSLFVAKCKVFIKYNTTVFPGKDTTLYDSYKIADDYGYVQFEQIVNGNYYLYAKGFDPNVAQEVWGYLPFNISVAKGETQEIDLTIPVSE